MEGSEQLVFWSAKWRLFRLVQLSDIICEDVNIHLFRANEEINCWVFCSVYFLFVKRRYVSVNNNKRLWRLNEVIQKKYVLEFREFLFFLWFFEVIKLSQMSTRSRQIKQWTKFRHFYKLVDVDVPFVAFRVDKNSNNSA